MRAWHGGVAALFLLMAVPAEALRFPVVNAGDDDADFGTLRKAIQAANDNPGPDLIVFDTDVCNPCTIQPVSPLPALVDDGTFIEGDTRVVLDGALAGAASGISIQSATNVISGLTIINFDGAGVLLSGGGAFDNTITGCFIGNDGTLLPPPPEGEGMMEGEGEVEGAIPMEGEGMPPRIPPLGNAQGGVNIENGASDNVVGGDTQSARNVISGNIMSAGVRIQNENTSGNRIIGNYIGTDASGLMSWPNQVGVVIRAGAAGNAVGGVLAGEGNLISGNATAGIGIRINSDPMMDAPDNTLLANRIGVGPTGFVAVANGTHGVAIVGASGAQIGDGTPAGRNIISGNGESGVVIESGASNTMIWGNYIGANVTGAAAAPNGQSGVLVDTSAQDTLVGGDLAGQGNLISGNGLDGVLIVGGAARTHVQGNTIGLDADGVRALGNGEDGVQVSNGVDTQIGGIVEAARNIISGNTLNGIRVSGASTTGTRIQNNFIGTAVNGQPAGVGNQSGIFVTVGALDTVVGSEMPQVETNAGNVIAGNLAEGVLVSDMTTMGCTIRANSIFGNVGDGIVVLDDANAGLASPVIFELIAAEDGMTTIDGVGPPATTIDLYVDTEDEGRVYLGATQASMGFGDYSVDFDLSGFVNLALTATATDAAGNTSEFSAPECIAGVGGCGGPVPGTSERFVDAANGSDATGNGSTGAPWASIGFALRQVVDDATEEDPIRLRISEGIYQERVEMEPNVILLGRDPNNQATTIIRPTPNQLASSNVAVEGAENTVVQDLSIELPLAAPNGATVVRANDVKMVLQNLVIDGRNVAASVGVSLINTGSSDSVMVRCTVRNLDQGVRSLESRANVTRNLFENIRFDAVFVSDPSKGMSTETPVLGDNTAMAQTGLNRFENIDDKFVRGIFSEPTMAELNDWEGLQSIPAIADKLSGDVEIEPILGLSDLAQTILVDVRDGASQAPIENATVGINPIVLANVSENVMGIYTFMGVSPPGEYTIRVSAPDYATKTASVLVDGLETKTVVIQLDPDLNHAADFNGDNVLSLPELLRIIQLYNSGEYHCDATNLEDGYAPGDGVRNCPPHTADTEQDWAIAFSALLRVIQFFNSDGLRYCPDELVPTEDGFCPESA